MQKFFHANTSSVRVRASSAKFITRENSYVYGIYIGLYISPIDPSTVLYTWHTHKYASAHVMTHVHAENPHTLRE